MHPEERAYVAKQITDTIVGARAQESIYLVRTRNGQYVSVIVFARCFRNRNDTPVLYPGMVVLESAAAANNHRAH
ncbi:PAS domain-containing protein [Ensifer sp. Root31]|uniref:PAS domain-containing protein n=1 Tax=Ensifer sp. Root31 TaxID=1736512 RepID=UPI000A87A06B|nr:PAS domain-containing protein [Ensifer sp. Root31]